MEIHQRKFLVQYHFQCSCSHKLYVHHILDKMDTDSVYHFPMMRLYKSDRYHLKQLGIIYHTHHVLKRYQHHHPKDYNPYV